MDTRRMPPKKGEKEDDLSQIRASQAQILLEIGKISTQQTEITALVTRVTDLVKEVNSLKVELGKKERRIVALESSNADPAQYSRIDDVIITGLKTRHRSYAGAAAAANSGGVSLSPSDEETESLETQVLHFFASRDIHVQSHNISACHPLPRKVTETNIQQPPAIIIRFVNRKHKIELMKQGRKLQKTGVYINEHLTKKNADIAKEARNLRKDEKIKSTWSRNCRVFIRTNGASPEEEKVFVIKEIGELTKYK